MIDRGALARAGLLVTGAVLVARLLGGVRLFVIYATFGAGRDLDSFVAAFRFPDLIFQLVAAGALSSALIPIVAGLVATDAEARAWRVASTVANLMLTVLLFLALVILLAAPALVPLVTQRFDAAQTAQTVELTRIMLVSPIFLALGSLATSLLNAKGRFAASVIAPITYNLAIIASAVFLAPTLGVVGLAIGVAAGSICHLAVQLLPLRAIGYRYVPRIDLGDPNARQALLLMVPRAIGLGASQLTFLVATALATGIGTGAASAFYLAFSIFQIPIGVIGIPIGVVMLPSLSGSLARGELAGYVLLVSRALRLLLWIMLPLAGLTIALHRELVILLFAYGRFDLRAIDLTAGSLVFLALAFASESLIAILARAFYAGQDTVTPLVAALLAVAINVGLAIVLVGRLGLAGIGLAIAVGSWVELVYLIVVLQRRVRAFEAGALAGAGGRYLAAALASSVVALLAMQLAVRGIGPAPSRPMLLLEVTIAGGLAGVVYLGLSRVLRVPEIGVVGRLLSSAFHREARA